MFLSIMKATCVNLYNNDIYVILKPAVCARKKRGMFLSLHPQIFFIFEKQNFIV